MRWVTQRLCQSFQNIVAIQGLLKVGLGAATETSTLTILLPQRRPIHSLVMRLAVRLQPAAVCSSSRSVRNVPMSIHQRGTQGDHSSAHPRFTACSLSAGTTGGAAHGRTGAAERIEAAESHPWMSFYPPPTSLHVPYCPHTAIITVHTHWCFEILLWFLSDQQKFNS